MAAVVHGQIDNCKTLLKRGADASMRVSEGESTLELAIRNQQLDVVKLLLDHDGIEVHSQSGKGGTMLDAAIEIDYADEEWIDGTRMQRVIASFSRIKLDIMKSLIEYGIDVNARAVDDGVGLHAAALVGDIEPVRILLDAGADPNLVDIGHRKPLWSAVRHNRIDTVRLLLPRTTDIKRSSLQWIYLSQYRSSMGQ